MSVAEHLSRVVKYRNAETFPRMAEGFLGALLHVQAGTSI
jgi:hypothetical protein